MDTKENRLYHEYLIRLDDELSTKLVHFSRQNDLTLTGTIRRSLRQFFQKEESPLPKQSEKNNDRLNESPDRQAQSTPIK